MTSSTTLIELLLNLLRDPSALDAYRDDPEGYLSSCGDVAPDDIREALVLLQDNQDADFDRDYNTGGNTVHIPPPPPAPQPEPGESDHEAAVQYLNTYITNNHIDDRDTITDNSVNQQIDTGGGDFDQDIDIDSTVASGDGAVAAGDDIEDSEIVTGDDNVVGDDNISGDGNVTGDDNETVTGDDNTTSFGDGDSTSTDIDGDVSVDDGGSVAVGGDSTVDNTDNSVDNSVEDSGNDNSENSVDDSFNDTTETTENTDYSIDDSYNDTSETTENSNNETEESIHTQVV
ncbi:IniB N-terminal domain-containing protein [Pseudonocardia sp. MH-G8]|uniref:IniB N-terminal domain-containing protein n=1 Tax=Pseudonocardia sp. MH-G8 TaxID=1854588 RepID=UPI000B9FC8EF|nr:IniB N-terminal domain-containing protein [Pseudonocardia sp. MH-G8]OZM82885.1 hypothetical protein CFP66_09475 [Pseudonocardia sp. MH-G8]